MEMKRASKKTVEERKKVIGKIRKEDEKLRKGEEVDGGIRIGRETKDNNGDEKGKQEDGGEENKR